MSRLRVPLLVEIPSNDGVSICLFVCLCFLVCPVAEGFGFRGKTRGGWIQAPPLPSIVAFATVNEQELGREAGKSKFHLHWSWAFTCWARWCQLLFHRCLPKGWWGSFKLPLHSYKVWLRDLIAFRTYQSDQCILRKVIQGWGSAVLSLIPADPEGVLCALQYGVWGNLECPLETESNHAFWMLRNKEIELLHLHHLRPETLPSSWASLSGIVFCPVHASCLAVAVCLGNLCH